jgi:hypothetical protein
MGLSRKKKERKIIGKRRVVGGMKGPPPSFYFVSAPSPHHTPTSFFFPLHTHLHDHSNTQTGNFCMPNCGEPWIECVFEGPEGRAEIQASPLVSY